MKSKLSHKKIGDLTEAAIQEAIDNNIGGYQLAAMYGVRPETLHDRLYSMFDCEKALILERKLWHIDQDRIKQSEKQKEKDDLARRTKKVKPNQAAGLLLSSQAPIIPKQEGISVTWGFHEEIKTTLSESKETEGQIGEILTDEVMGGMKLKYRELCFCNDLNAVMAPEDARIGSLGKRIKMLEENIASMKSRISETNKQIADLEFNIHENEGRITRAKESIVWYLPKKIQDLHEKIDHVQEQIDSCTGNKLEQAKQKYDEYVAKLSESENKIEQAKLKIEKTEGQIATDEATIVELRADLVVFKENIDMFKTFIAETKAEIKKLTMPRLFVKEFEEGLVLASRYCKSFDECMTGSNSTASQKAFFDWYKNVRAYCDMNGLKVDNDVFIVVVKILFLTDRIDEREAFAIDYDGERSEIVHQIINDFYSASGESGE